MVTVGQAKPFSLVSNTVTVCCQQGRFKPLAFKVLNSGHQGPLLPDLSLLICQFLLPTWTVSLYALNFLCSFPTLPLLNPFPQISSVASCF